jgi:hypothetical protein
MTSLKTTWSRVLFLNWLALGHACRHDNSGAFPRDSHLKSVRRAPAERISLISGSRFDILLR